MSKLGRRLKHVFCAAAATGLLVGGCISHSGLEGRGLTSGETALARSVFGETVDYGKVHVYEGAPKVAGIFPLSQHGLGAITPCGDIYLVGKNCQQPDLSKAGEKQRKLLIHEMTHVWQYQQGQHVECDAVFLYVRSGFNYNSCYAYDLDGRRKFASLNIEQQAHMVEDYFALRDQKARAVPDRAVKMAKFEAMLKPCLPLSDKPCAPQKPR